MVFVISLSLAWLAFTISVLWLGLVVAIYVQYKRKANYRIIMGCLAIVYLIGIISAFVSVGMTSHSLTQKVKFETYF